MTEQAGEYADMMNGYPRYVVSTTLEQPLGWNNSTLIKGDVAEEVPELKRQPGGDIMVFPVVLGSRQRLFGEGIEETVLELVGTDTFDTGVVVLTYRPAEKKAAG